MLYQEYKHTHTHTHAHTNTHTRKHHSPQNSYNKLTCTSCHMAMRALANLSHEGANRCSSNSSVESLLTERDQCFYGYQRTHFSLEKNRRKAKTCSIKSYLSVSNDVLQTGYKPKTFLCRTGWVLKVHLAQSRIARLLAPGESRLDIEMERFEEGGEEVYRM